MSKDKPQSILVVDDNPVNLRLLVGVLTDQGYEVRPAPSGRHALATIKKARPDLILLDIMMPDMDGYEVCGQLKASEVTRDIPIIFISALNETFDKVTAFSVGGVDYITKPVQAEEVLARVHTHLALRKAQQKLEEKNQQLQQKNRELDAFAHTVAHDLKNPLTKIITSLAVLQEYVFPALDEEMQGMVQMSQQTGQDMVKIIDELLLLASIRQEQIEVTPMDMSKIVYRVQNRLSHMIEAYQAEIIIQTDWPLALGHAPWIEEVWANYLSNGLKYGGTPPKLSFGSTPQPNDMVRFWIRDNGPGLPIEAQQTLFTKFTRLDEVRVTGHGLGLSIVRHIVEKLGGHVGVESEAGQGCEFYFSLPLEKTGYKLDTNLIKQGFVP